MLDIHEPLVFSMTAFAHAKRCRKLFDYADLRHWESLSDKSEAMEQGSQFHKWMERAAQFYIDGTPPEGEPDAMQEVAAEYLRHNPLPTVIVDAERPRYVRVLAATSTTPEVWLRCTLDLVYVRNDDVIVGRDYKTFDRMPSTDMDLDWQGAIYAAVLDRLYMKSAHKVAFEWEFVRREVGRYLAKGTKWQDWTVEERYVNVPRVMTEHEIVTTWVELGQLAQDLVRAINEKRLYRSELKGPINGCDNCFYKVPCKSEFAYGELSQTDLDTMVRVADPAARMSVQGMLDDPRVQAMVLPLQPGAAEKYVVAHSRQTVAAVKRYYGETGLAKLEASCAVNA